MAQALNKTKRRIASVKNTQKITEAMELIATIKLKKFKNVMEKNHAYASELENIISHLFGLLDDDDNVYLKEGKSDKELVIVINSDLGLCASYNIDITNFVVRNFSKENTILLNIGEKGDFTYHNEGYELIRDFVNLNEKLSYNDCVKLSRYIHSEFILGKYKCIKILYTKFINSIRFEPTLKQIFPIKRTFKKAGIGYEPIYDPNIKTLIDELVPINLTSTIYQSVIESQISEQMSRRNAMENANDNADEIIEKLTLEFNKARQASITQEILEIVASQGK